MHSITKAEDAREAIRGSTALVDGARLVYALWPISGEAEIGPCQALNLPLNKQSIVCGCVVKANDVADRDVRFYGRSKSGLLEDRTTEIEIARKIANEMTEAQIDKLFDEIELRWNREHPFSHAAQGGDRYIIRWMTDNLKVSKQCAKRHIDQWLDDGHLSIELLNSNSKQKGICTVKRPEPDAQEARGFMND
jgi:hypothetical protein